MAECFFVYLSGLTRGVPLKVKPNRVCIPSWGAVTGLVFENGGSAEVVLNPVEFHRLLDTWEQHELGKKRPDERVLAALRTLSQKARTSAPCVLAEVPITRSRRVQLIPDLDDEKS
jgi:hypothetical protein